MPHIINIFFGVWSEHLRFTFLVNFKYTNTVLLTIVTTLYIRSAELFILLLDVYTLCLSQHLSCFLTPPPSTWQPPFYSASMNSALFLASTCKRDHTVFVFLCLTYFTYYSALKVHACCCKRQKFFHFYGWIIFHCMYIPHLLYPLMDT